MSYPTVWGRSRVISSATSGTQVIYGRYRGTSLIRKCLPDHSHCALVMPRSPEEVCSYFEDCFIETLSFAGMAEINAFSFTYEFVRSPVATFATMPGTAAKISVWVGVVLPYVGDHQGCPCCRLPSGQLNPVWCQFPNSLSNTYTPRGMVGWSD